jgi:Rrf2 family protein
MNLSQASRYALHALEFLASLGEEKPVPSHVIAEARGLSGGFLLKALKLLVDGGLLRSQKGPQGGYRLARPASKITLLDVVEAVDGPVLGRAPVEERAGARADLDARLQAACDQAALVLRRQWGKVRITDLAARA